MEIHNHVADILIGQRLTTPDLLPVRMTKIGAASNHDGSQTLIAYERQIGGVGDLLLPVLVTGSAARAKDAFSPLHAADRV
jgi:hypothetical protein